MARKKNSEPVEREPFDWGQYQEILPYLTEPCSSLVAIAKVMQEQDPCPWTGTPVDASPGIEHIECLVKAAEGIHSQIGIALKALREEVEQAKASQVLRFCS